MKFLGGVLLFLGLATNAFAHGKIQVEGRLYPNSYNDQFKPVIGLAVYEKIAGPFALNAWTGLGDQPITDFNSSQWYTAKAYVETNMSKELMLGVGAGASYVFDSKMWHEYFAVKASYKLW